jgi:hypothetical protein
MDEIEKQPPYNSSEIYYYSSRQYFWSFEEFIELLFNSPRLECLVENSEQARLCSRVMDFIDGEKIQAFTLRKGSRGENESPFVPIKLPISKNNFDNPYRSIYLPSEQAFSFACKEKILEGNLKFIAFTKSDFYGMMGEMFPYDFISRAYDLDSWSTPNLVRIIFGERYQEWPLCLSNKMVHRFVDLLEGEVATGSLKPLQFVPGSSAETWRFFPIDLVRFVRRYDNPFKTHGIEIIGWVDNLFNSIEAQEGQAKENISQNVVSHGRKKPHPTTDRGRMLYFKEEVFIPAVEKILSENPEWQNHQVLEHNKIDNAMDKCGFTEGKPSPSAIKKWISIARKNIGAKAKKGRPSQ